ncbi:lipid IV(A) 3-deoxy-D-manno-octulosonic acid transferase [Candidatus Enterovibrio escicola]|uniref:3-deoxy-D-manno-octulosonic acid transferase n=1 Tax=Candidatus Enterovibrio escicola TaxID=1927127 RepID=A0A2A5SZ41_9GAMM|nr:lipid IV(A) 3-deoxy-D-manno-octulosonic acid transferase [Candidatus Enterovibrio escacola]PCS21150.1 Lipid IVA 3-deoxy-D-manno-octulosonic acid transferase [Candidatus Enterovibrio escacola]
MSLLYSLLLAISTPFLLFGLYRSQDGKPNVGKRWGEHFGFTPKLTKTSPIWIHAVSVGEVIAAKPLILALKKKYPYQIILVTTTTATGADIVAGLGNGIVHRYMPIDFTFAVKHFLKRINPKIMLIMETELWPNTLVTVNKAGIPVIVINARLSERAMHNYQKIQPLFNILSKNIDHILCQFENDAHRFIQLGVAKNKVSVSGSVKFDLPFFDETIEAVTTLKHQLKGRPVWIAASTHEGEDEILLDAHRAVLDKIPNSVMILVPRHPERFNDVATLIKQKVFSQIRRSTHQPITEKTHVYLGDTMGEMMILLAVSNVVFMAGSLVDKKVGGHNFLEPASLSQPLITGSSYFNFQVIADQLIAVGACTVSDNVQEIAETVIERFNNPIQRQILGDAARNIVNKNRGAVSKTLETIAMWITPSEE